MSTAPRPAADCRVDVWYARVEGFDPSRLDRCRQLLDSDELARADRFVFDRDRQLFTVAHALLRHSLSRYGQLAPQDWRFEKNRYGRPELIADQNPERIRFNLTHTRGLAACAVTYQHDLGIDAECIGRRDVSEAVARRFFAPQEVDELRQAAATERHVTFLNFWTLKESYIKARGVGMAIPLSQFWFSSPAQPEVSIAFSSRIDDQPDDWHFVRHTIDEQFLLALAVRVPNLRCTLDVRIAEDVELGTVAG